MNKYKKPHINEDRLGKNPFLTNLKVTVNRVALPDQWKSVKEGEDMITLPAEMEMEKTPFTKVYVDSERRKDMVKLSPRAKDLLLWILYEVELNKDWLWINKKRYMEENGVKTYNTYNAAVNELIQEGYISRVASPANVFFLNPHYFFNGNRIRSFPKNVIIK